MRVAIVHYHLRGGGVTRVIQRTMRVLAEAKDRAVVLAGEPPPTVSACEGKVRIVAGAGYAGPGESQPAELAAALLVAAREALGGLPDVWHFHNHALGKNPALTAAVSLLAGEGQRLLLQVHDFAEDGRPANYRSLRRALGNVPVSRRGALLYPQARNVHYAVLNRRDRGLLVGAGVEPSRLHLLGNPVDAPDLSGRGASDDSRRRFLYPVRAIRRKNLGELLLWAAALGGEHRFAVSLAPDEPEARAAYERWTRLAARLGLPVTFDAADGGRRPLAEVFAESTEAITTSIAEGFGMAFLEPWLAGRPLSGRDLPDVTSEFRDRGIRLDSLYERLEIPSDWIDGRELRLRIDAALRDSRASYGRSVKRHEIDAAFAAAVRGNRVDVGHLDEELQEDVIRRMVADPEMCVEMQPRSPIVSPPTADHIAANAAAVRKHYGLQAFGRALRAVYDAVAASDAGMESQLSAERLLDHCLDPARFRLLMT